MNIGNIIKFKDGDVGVVYSGRCKSFLHHHYFYRVKRYHYSRWCTTLQTTYTKIYEHEPVDYTKIGECR
jgi:hypothetical protein